MSIWQMNERERRREDARPWSMIERVVVFIGVWAVAMVGVAGAGILPH